MAFVSPPAISVALEVRTRTNTAVSTPSLTIVRGGSPPYPTVGQTFPLGNR